MKTKLRDGVEIVHNSRNVMTVYCTGITAGWKLDVLLRADAHHDNVHCDRKLEKEHLEEVKSRNGLMADFGDLFCAMQGKFDPRKSYSELRPEYKLDNYLDAIVEDAAKFYGPYAPYWLVSSPGNHESSILKNNGVDLTNNLVHRLNTEHNGRIQRGGYGGYIRFMFNSGKSHTRILKYFHGSGGSGGQASIRNQATIYPDADVVINGHAHVSWHWPIVREKISERGVVSRAIQHHVRTGTYKDGYRDGAEGWEVEGGQVPKPLGAVWLQFKFAGNDIEIDINQSVR